MDPRMIPPPPPPPVLDAMGQSLTDMDAQMRDILERTDLSLHDKANLYQQTLWRFLSRFGQYRNRPLGMVDVRPQEPTTPSPPPSPPPLPPPPPPVVQEDPVEAETWSAILTGGSLLPKKRSR
ncbi:hypothetical protein C0Q70_04691 [Pomacea canaliculata]|uniref:Uncharacterized protein n=1 Tax=Pomacea canaliculata TaxID=400727 RepID=A0A2T7PJ29_POMCA|nr:hypothetical protein C0Q70_04691 [Pomacea canaliculata]